MMRWNEEHKFQQLGYVQQYLSNYAIIWSHNGKCFHISSLENLKKSTFYRTLDRNVLRNIGLLMIRWNNDYKIARLVNNKHIGYYESIRFFVCSLKKKLSQGHNCSVRLSSMDMVFPNKVLHYYMDEIEPLSGSIPCLFRPTNTMRYHFDLVDWRECVHLIIYEPMKHYELWRNAE